MTTEESLKLIELMIKMDYEPSLIMLTLCKSEGGVGIGHAFMKAYTIWKERECKTDTPK